MNVFISHSTDERELAICLTNWLKSSLTDVEIFCSSRPGDLAGKEWRSRVHEKGFKSNIFISLLSHESAVKPWIHFEAGLATAGGASVVPAIYGGLQINDVPSTLTFAQIVDLTDEEAFNASLLEIFKSYINGDNDLTLNSFLETSKTKSKKDIARFLKYGRLGVLVEGEILSERHDHFELTPDSRAKDLPILKDGNRISAVRVVMRPLTTGDNAWACGLAIGKKDEMVHPRNREREFAFHTGRHHGRTTFTIYPSRKMDAFFDVPAMLDFGRDHSIQIWFNSRGNELQIAGVDSSGKYYLITHDGKNSVWQPAITDCDTIRLYSWKGNHRISIEQLDVDYIKTKDTV